jgi:hypothetical protein
MTNDGPVIIAVQGAVPLLYPSVKGQGVPGVFRALTKSGKADIAVRRADGVTERLLVPIQALRLPALT